MIQRSLILLVALHALPFVESGESQEPPAEVRADPRVELMAIVWRLAGSHVFDRGGLEPYVTDPDRHFGPYRDQPGGRSRPRAAGDGGRLQRSDEHRGSHERSVHAP